MNFKFIPFIFILWLFTSCKESEIPIDSEEIISLANNKFAIDTENGIVVYNGTNIQLNQGEVIIEDLVFETENTPRQIELGKPYDLEYGQNQFTLFITELPILSISTSNAQIVDEPKIPASFYLYEKDKPSISYNMGIEIRGGVSKDYPKPSYSIELWVNKNATENLKVSLLGMRTDDDWILDGLWNEPIRIRDYTAHDIWLDMSRTEDENKKLKNGIDCRYCELFVNGVYKGVYYLGEKIDHKQLDLKKYDGTLQGELYKAVDWDEATLYNGLCHMDNDFDYWCGYEAKYPDQIGELDWTNLYKHTGLILFGNTGDFNSEIASVIDMKNAIDYFILLNLIFATDNVGKNIYIAKMAKNKPYFFIPWDMDGSFGNNWMGERTNITNEILTNGLYDRLLKNQNFKAQAKSRYTALRKNELSEETLHTKFYDNYSLLESNGVYYREQLVEGLTFNYSSVEIDFIQDWITERLAYLDTYFASL